VRIGKRNAVQAQKSNRDRNSDENHDNDAERLLYRFKRKKKASETSSVDTGFKNGEGWEGETVKCRKTRQSAMEKRTGKRRENKY
jgi:hypothetical protein